MIEKDVVVVGSGGAGLVAAITAARGGLDVLVIEKAPYFGGTTALSGGGLWVPGNPMERAAGLADSAQEAKEYVVRMVGQNLRVEMVDAYLAHAPRMIDFLLANTGLRFQLAAGQPDWGPNLPGARQHGRLINPEPFDGRRLGPYFSQLRPPRTEFNAPGGFMIDFADIPHITTVTSSLRSFAYMVPLGLRFAVDRLSYKRGTRLTMGNALAGGLLKGAIDAGVELWRGTPVTELKRTDGRVCGVVATRNGETVQVHARRGVVLASGGFSANAEMRRRYLPFPDQHISITSEGNTGDGIAMAERVGGRLDEGNYHNASWAVVSTYTKPDGALVRYAHLLDMGKPGCIAVDAKGERFGNEADENFAVAMHDARAVPAHIICDAPFIKKYGFGLVYPGAPNLKQLLAVGYVKEAPTLRALAQIIAVDPSGLKASVAKVNADAVKGIDSAFHKGESVVDQSVGDPTHAPNPCFGALTQGPFYAIKINPGDGSTALGLCVDHEARVLDKDNRPIPGLYASGLDMNSIWRGRYPAHGTNNGMSTTFGFIAAQNLIKAA